MFKTKPAVAMLRFRPRKVAQPVLLPRPLRRVSQKTRPADLVLIVDVRTEGPKRKRICAKTPAANTAYEPVQ